jgi:hypothetical protein
MSKSTKTQVLTNWFGLDYILFRKPASEALKGDQLSQYLTTKGALLSNLFEIYHKMGHSPKMNFKTVKEMDDHAKTAAESAKKRSLQYLKEDSVVSLVKKEIKSIGLLEGLTEEQVAKYVIKKRRDSVAIDSLVLESIIKGKGPKPLKDWQGKVLVDAHKALRDSLVEIALA